MVPLCVPLPLDRVMVPATWFSRNWRLLVRTTPVQAIGRVRKALA